MTTGVTAAATAGVVLATAGAGVGLSAGLAFNLRLARALGTPTRGHALGAALVNFAVGAAVLLGIWALGAAARVWPPATAAPPAWALLGGAFGATYVSLALAAAARLGAAVSTVAVTFGQVVGALGITGLGWLGQAPHRPAPATLATAVLLLVAVALLGRDRERAASVGGAGSDRAAPTRRPRPGPAEA